MYNNSVLNIYGHNENDSVPEYQLTSQDYFVHMLRFHKLAKSLRGKNILDIGCGRFTNLLRALMQMNRGIEFESYVGVDIGKIIPYRQNYKPLQDVISLRQEVDFSDRKQYSSLLSFCGNFFGKRPVTVICFEVLEHMSYDMQKRFMFNLGSLLSKHSGLNIEVCYFSTPNFNGKPAKTHISELSYLCLEELMQVFEFNVRCCQGLSVKKRLWSLDEALVNKEQGTLLNVLENYLPLPLLKMIWGAIMPRRYSNNILYTIDRSDVVDLFNLDGDTVDERITKIFALNDMKFQEFRQGGENDIDCKF